MNYVIICSSISTMGSVNTECTANAFNPRIVIIRIEIDNKFYKNIELIIQ